MRVAADSTNVSVILRIVDSAAGTPETGVTSATSGIALGYWREGAASFTGLTESDLATLDAAHSDGGLLHINGGYYRVDIPDAAFASGADRVLIGGTITDMVVVGLVVEIGPTLDSINTALATVDTNVDSILADTGTDGVVLANDAITAAKFDESTAFPLAAADSGATQVARTGADADTLETLSDQLDAVKTDTAATLTDTNELQTDWANGGRLDLILDARASQTSVDDVPTNSELTTALAAADDAVLAAIAALNNISVANVMAGTVEGAETLAQTLRLMRSVLLGKSSGGGSTTITFRDAADSKARVTATVTSDGNRTAITTDAT